MIEDKETFLNKLKTVYDPHVSVWYKIHMEEGLTHEQAIATMLRNKYITRPCIGLPAHCRELKTK